MKLYYVCNLLTLWPGDPMTYWPRFDYWFSYLFTLKNSFGKGYQRWFRIVFGLNTATFMWNIHTKTWNFATYISGTVGFHKNEWYIMMFCFEGLRCYIIFMLLSDMLENFDSFRPIMDELRNFSMKYIALSDSPVLVWRTIALRALFRPKLATLCVFIVFSFEIFGFAEIVIFLNVFVYNEGFHTNTWSCTNYS